MHLAGPFCRRDCRCPGHPPGDRQVANLLRPSLPAPHLGRDGVCPLTGHEEVRHEIGAMLLDALSPEEALRVRAHIKVCPACGREVAELRGIPSLLRQLARKGASNLEATITAPAPSFLRPGRPRTEWKRWVAAFGTLVLAGATVVLVGAVRTEPGIAQVALRPAAGVLQAGGTVGYTAESWGTQLLLKTHSLPGAGRCTIWVVGGDGSWQSVGSWNSAGGKGSEVEVATWLRPNQIAEVVLESGAGRPLLTARGPGSA